MNSWMDTQNGSVNLLFLALEIISIAGLFAAMVWAATLKARRRRQRTRPPKGTLKAEIMASMPEVCIEYQQRLLIQDQEIEALQFSLRTSQQSVLFWRHIAQKRAELLEEFKGFDG